MRKEVIKNNFMEFLKVVCKNITSKSEIRYLNRKAILLYNKSLFNKFIRLLENHIAASSKTILKGIYFQKLYQICSISIYNNLKTYRNYYLTKLKIKGLKYLKEIVNLSKVISQF